MKKLLIAALLAFSFLAAVPPVSAQASSFDETLTGVSVAVPTAGTYVADSIAANTGGTLAVIDGAIVGTHQRSVSGTSRCSVWATTDGSTFFPDKEISTSTRSCTNHVGTGGNTWFVPTFENDGYYFSTNGGISWTSKTVEGTNTASGIRMAAFDANDWTWAGGINSASSKYSNTANGGTTWTLANTVTQAALNDVHEVWNLGAGDEWATAYEESGGFTTMVVTDDDWATVTTNTIPVNDVGSGGGDFTCRSIQPFEGDTYCFFVYPSADSAFATSNDMGYLVSTDNGATWGPYERPFIAPSGDLIAPAYSYVSDGKLWVIGTHNIGSNTVFLASYDGADWQFFDVDTDNTPTALLGFIVRDGKAWVNYRTGTPNSDAVEYLMQVTFEGSSVIAVDDLTGFDMDPTGTTIITRENPNVGTDTIRTYSTAGGFALGGEFEEDDCGRIDGVAALANHVIFVDCDGSGDPEFFRIRSSTLDAPVKPDTCSGGYCHDDLTEGTGEDIFNVGGLNIPEDVKEIGHMEGARWDYSRSTTAGTNHATISFTFSTIDEGKVGVFAATFNNNDVDFSDTDEAQYLVNTAPGIAQICSARYRTTPDSYTHSDDASNQDYLFAVSDGAATVGWGIDLDVNSGVDEGGGLSSEAPEVDMTEIFRNSIQYGNAAGIACAQDRALIQKVSEVCMRDIYAPGISQLWCSSKATNFQRAVALSHNGKVAAYRDDAEIHVVNATDGTIYTTVAVPTGNWKGMELDALGQVLVIATSDFLTMYEICESTDTCEEVIDPSDLDDVIDGGDPDGGDPDGGSGSSGPAGGVLVSTTPPQGWTVDAFNGFLGFLLMAMIGGGMYLLSGNKIGAAGIGAAAGFVLAFFFGLFGIGLIVLAAVVATAIIFVKVKGTASGA